ncbi:MAG: hypothetical protein CL959_04660 [Euryarchaeota archaeon]|nr:hypothetical protein [Euryarchaeota archaeon]
MNNTYIIRLSDGQDTVIELPKPKVEKDGKVWVFDHEGEQYTLHHDAFFMDQWTLGFAQYYEWYGSEGFGEVGKPEHGRYKPKGGVEMILFETEHEVLQNGSDLVHKLQEQLNKEGRYTKYDFRRTNMHEASWTTGCSASGQRCVFPEILEDNSLPSLMPYDRPWEIVCKNGKFFHLDRGTSHLAESKI